MHSIADQSHISDGSAEDRSETSGELSKRWTCFRGWVQWVQMVISAVDFQSQSLLPTLSYARKARLKHSSKTFVPAFSVSGTKTHQDLSQTKNHRIRSAKSRSQKPWPYPRLSGMVCMLLHVVSYVVERCTALTICDASHALNQLDTLLIRVLALSAQALVAKRLHKRMSRLLTPLTSWHMCAMTDDFDCN